MEQKIYASQKNSTQPRVVMVETFRRPGCRHAARQAQITPLVLNHTSPIENVDFFYTETFFLVIVTVKTRPGLKRAWQGLPDNWYTVGKVMGSCWKSYVFKS